MARDGNGRKAGYKVNRYETTTRQHPTSCRPSLPRVSRSLVAFPSPSSAPFPVDFSISLFFSLSRCALDFHEFHVRITVDPPYTTRATFRHGCTKRCPVPFNYSDTFISLFHAKLYIFELEHFIVMHDVKYRGKGN